MQQRALSIDGAPGVTVHFAGEDLAPVWANGRLLFQNVFEEMVKSCCSGRRKTRGGGLC